MVIIVSQVALLLTFLGLSCSFLVVLPFYFVSVNVKKREKGLKKKGTEVVPLNIKKIKNEKFFGGLWQIRTVDLFRVKEAL